VAVPTFKTTIPKPARWCHAPSLLGSTYDVGTFSLHHAKRETYDAASAARFSLNCTPVPLSRPVPRLVLPARQALGGSRTPEMPHNAISS
jgi:hypothetical protein